MGKLVALHLKMIVTIVDGGSGQDVVDFSKEAGAVGGTILHGRGSGVHDAGKFFGLEIQPEKDIVLTLVPAEMELAVMEAIGKGIRIDKPANGICFSIDIDKAMGMTSIKSFGETKTMDELNQE